MEKLGIRKERLQLEWVSAAEANRWRDVMEEMEELRKSVTPEEVVETRKLMKEQRKKPKKATKKKKAEAEAKSS